MFKWFKRKPSPPPIEEILANMMKASGQAAALSVVHAIFASIGIEDMEKIIARAKENQGKLGHNDYTSLAELYLELLRQRGVKKHEYDTPV